MKALTEVDSGRHIDAFVVDVAMPRGNPHGVSLALMMQRRRPHTPILLMTGFPEVLDDYTLPGKVLFKPIDLDTLTREVEALFQAPPVH